jgi:hypothetical protein
MEASAEWIARGEARLPPGLVVSFQRFAWPEGGVIARSPSSLGGLPIGIGKAGDLVLPLAIDECFWIGWSRAPGASVLDVAVAVELDDGVVIDAATGARFDEARAETVSVPGTPRVEGIRRPDGRFDVFVRETHHGEGHHCRRVRLHVTGGPLDPFAVAIRLLDYATFAAESGQSPPPPLDVSSGYKGWRLP